MKLKCICFMLIFLYSVFKNLVLIRTATVRSGPFKTVILNVKNKCDDVIKPYEKVPTGCVTVEIDKLPNGAQVMKTNITVLRNNRGIMMRMKGFRWENEEWKLTISRNDIGCRSAIFPLMIQQTGLNIDMKQCSVPKGTYILKDVNMNDLDHILTQKREYGKMKWRVEVYLQSATVTCFEYETAILPVASSS